VKTAKVYTIKVNQITYRNSLPRADLWYCKQFRKRWTVL